VFSLAAIVHFGLLSPPCTFPGIQIIRHSAYHFFALCSTASYLLSGLRQPSHPARIFSGILPDPFYLLPARRLPARRLPAHVTLVIYCINRIYKNTGFEFFCISKLKLPPLVCHGPKRNAEKLPK